MGEARPHLLHSSDPAVRSGWQLARLWLGPTVGGPVVAGTVKLSMVSPVRGTKAFLDRKQHVPVATADMFVGRRREMQQALRVLRSGDRAGVLLHGQGRVGKSSLAARIADRMPDYAVGVVYGDYTALAVLDAIREAVSTDPEARKKATEGVAEVRERPEAIESVLIDLLNGPCAQVCAGHKPLLLVIDDLEQILSADHQGPHRVDNEYAPVLAGVIRAFDWAESDSRLLVTSRYCFDLGGWESRLVAVPLRPLSSAARAKLLRRQAVAAPPEHVRARRALAERGAAVSRGNPGLQDLIVSRLVYGQHVDVARAEAAVASV